MSDQVPKKNTKKTLVKLAVVVVVLAALIVGTVAFNLPQQLQRALLWVDGLGAIGPAIFIALYIVATVLFVPGSVLTLGAGAIWGPLLGTIYVSIGSTIGAICAFLVGRYLLRGWVERQAASKPRFKAVDEAIGREGGKIIFLLRLSPLFPFNLSNYIYSLSKVRFLAYCIATWAGILPGTIMYVYLGSLLKIGGEAQTRSTAEWVLYGVGLVATVLVTIYVGRVANRAIKKTVT